MESEHDSDNGRYVFPEECTKRNDFRFAHARRHMPLQHPRRSKTTSSPPYPRTIRVLGIRQPPMHTSHHHFNPRLDSNPRNRNHNVHALLLRALPLIAVSAVLLVVPVRAHSAVHAAAPVLLRFRRDANVLDHGAVDDVFVRGLRGLASSAGAGCLFDQGF